MNTVIIKWTHCLQWPVFLPQNRNSFWQKNVISHDHMTRNATKCYKCRLVEKCTKYDYVTQGEGRPLELGIWITSTYFASYFVTLNVYCVTSHTCIQVVQFLQLILLNIAYQWPPFYIIHEQWGSISAMWIMFIWYKTPMNKITLIFECIL